MQSDLIPRPRLNALLTQAIKKPLVLVCASMGCGKSRAVYDFTQTRGAPALWVDINEADNDGKRLWELFINTVSKYSLDFAGECKKLGFPNTEEKLSRFAAAFRKALSDINSIVVFDDFHLLSDPPVLRFMEKLINDFSRNITFIIITRALPKINVSKLMMQDNISIINEAELNYTESEITQLLIAQGLDEEIRNIKNIYNDTKGWAFLVGFVARMLKRTPGYMGYVSIAIKRDVDQLIEMEVWSHISDRLKNLLLRLSMTNHYSAGLVETLSGPEPDLLAELKSRNAFIRFNKHMASWHIHPALLDFLRAKQSLLTDEEKLETYKISADWCIQSGFIIDALSYYGKTGDYSSIVSALLARKPHVLEDHAEQLYGIFSQMPEEVYDRVEFAAALHVQVSYFVTGMEKALELSTFYEARFASLPRDSAFRRLSLGAIYYCQAYLRMLMSTFDDCYDFVEDFAKMHECLKDNPVDPKCWYQHPMGMWTTMVGVSRKDATHEYIEALSRASGYLQASAQGLSAGIDDLSRGELLFYQGSISEAKFYFNSALSKAMERDQKIITHRSLFYLLRVAVYQGDYRNAEDILKKMEETLAYSDCLTYVINNDISKAWFFCVISRPERIPGWLKESFVPYARANSLDNFSNQIRARYNYLIKSYAALLGYIDDQKRRESIIYGRIELLAMEACARFKMNEREASFQALREAYDAATANEIVMPFIEMGKDMRALVNAAAGRDDSYIPPEWLRMIKQSVSAYISNNDQIISAYRKKNDVHSAIMLSSREMDILRSMYGGLSSDSIAMKYGLASSAMRVHINAIYEKLGARNKADALRIAAENNLLK